eukprot:8726508-Pyramimonas_sp.AAC.1
MSRRARVFLFFFWTPSTVAHARKTIRCIEARRHGGNATATRGSKQRIRITTLVLLVENPERSEQSASQGRIRAPAPRGLAPARRRTRRPTSRAFPN